MYDSELNKLLLELRKLDLKKEPAAASLDLLMDLNPKSVQSQDKDLTLSEYLNKYSSIEDTIEAEQKKTDSRSSYEELLRDLEGSSEEYLNRKIDEDFDYREVKTIFARQENGNEEIKTKDIFTNKSKERCNNVQVRIQSYANTKASLTSERRMGPLNLEQFHS